MKKSLADSQIASQGDSGRHNRARSYISQDESPSHRTRNVFIEAASYHNLAMMDERSLCGDAEWNEIKRTVINSVKGEARGRNARKKGGNGLKGVTRRLN